jgi:hypothetical protein
MVNSVSWHLCWYLHLFECGLLVITLSSKKFDLNLETLHYSSNGIFVIFISMDFVIFSMVPRWVLFHLRPPAAYTGGQLVPSKNEQKRSIG